MLRSLFSVRRQFFGKNQVTAYALAATCAEFGDEACVKSYLAMSVARHETENVALLIDPPFARFHKAVWFPALLAKTGLAQPGRGSSTKSM